MAPEPLVDSAAGLPEAEGTPRVESDAKPDRLPPYTRYLRLRTLRPNAWQRAVVGEGSFGVAALLVLADLATAWTLVVFPLAVAAAVKGHDMLATVLNQQSRPAMATRRAQTTTAPPHAGTTPSGDVRRD